MKKKEWEQNMHIQYKSQQQNLALSLFIDEQFLFFIFRCLTSEMGSWEWVILSSISPIAYTDNSSIFPIFNENYVFNAVLIRLFDHISCCYFVIIIYHERNCRNCRVEHLISSQLRRVGGWEVFFSCHYSRPEICKRLRSPVLETIYGC